MQLGMMKLAGSSLIFRHNNLGLPSMLGKTKDGNAGWGGHAGEASRHIGRTRESRLSGSLQGVLRHLDKVLFGLGVLAVVFAWGVAVGSQRLFPYRLIDQAVEAGRDWQENWRHYLGIRSRYAQPVPHAKGGVVVHEAGRTMPGHTFMTLFRDGRFGASLIDAEGRRLHDWDIAFSQAFPQASHLETVPPDFDTSFHGAVLLENGDVVANFLGLGTVRLDRCSRPVWTIARETHHAVERLPGGGFLIPSRHRRTAADPRHPQLQPGAQGRLWEDTVLHVAEDGRVLDEASMLDVVYGSRAEALLLGGPEPSGDVRADDPLHLNDVEVLREGMAAFPLFKAGDVMVSFRNINTIAVLDGDDWLMKWSMTGPFLMQHDPDFLANGHIMVFDNRGTGATPLLGQSRVLEIDPGSQKIVWSYEGDSGAPFYTPAQGQQQPLPNGNVLVVESKRGRVFEVTRTGPEEIVWAFVNQVGEGLVGSIADAVRVPTSSAGFAGRSCG
jgi:hypothetical protein